MTPARPSPINLQRRSTLRLAAAVGLAPLGLLAGPQRVCLAQADAANAEPKLRVRWGVDGSSSDGSPGGDSLTSAHHPLQLSEPLIVRLEVWVSTWFLAPIDFPATLASTTALSEAIDGSPESTFEEHAGQRWTGLIRRYRVQPLQAGELLLDVVDALEILPGRGEGQTQRVRPPEPLRLQVQVPPGAEGLQPFIAARRLELHQQWQPEMRPEARWQVGDAIRRELELITDSRSPLLPTPDFGRPAGVELRIHEGIRKQQQDPTQSGLQRFQYGATHVLHDARTVELPAIEVAWWDLEQQRVRISRLPGITLEVAAAAARPDPFLSAAPPSARHTFGAGSPSPSSPFSSTASARAASWGLAALLGLALARWGWHRRKPAMQVLQQRLQKTGVDEVRARWQLRRACLRDDPAAAQRALSLWLGLLPAATREAIHADPACSAAMRTLARQRHGPSTPGSGGSWTGRALWQAVRMIVPTGAERARKRAHNTQLPTLNP